METPTRPTREKIIFSAFALLLVTFLCGCTPKPAAIDGCSSCNSYIAAPDTNTAHSFQANTKVDLR